MNNAKELTTQEMDTQAPVQDTFSLLKPIIPMVLEINISSTRGGMVLRKLVLIHLILQHILLRKFCL